MGPHERNSGMGFQLRGLHHPNSQEKCTKIIQLIKRILKHKKCPLKRFQELLGKLKHASLGIPGGAGLFSPSNAQLITICPTSPSQPTSRRPCFDWKVMIQQQLVPDYPDYVVYSNVRKLGAGGIWSPWCEGLPHTV